MKNNNSFVCVQCKTFNQSSYILDAMNGFTMQQTTFPYVCCILDDASTDGEPEVIKHYFEEHFDLNSKSIFRNEETDDYVLYFAQHKINKNCYFAVCLLKYNHYSLKKTKRPYISEWQDKAKYVAKCEGDDYWIDPLKLQKQYNFMEAHPECSICFHANYDLYPSGEKRIRKPKKIKEFNTPEDTILGGGDFMATNSMFFRGDYFYLLIEEQPDFVKCSPVGDRPLKLYFATKGVVGYIDEVMSVYRRQAINSWSSRQNSLRIKTMHKSAAIKMYDEYDKYTKGKYHQAILKMKCIIIKKIIKDFFKAFKEIFTS